MTTAPVLNEELRGKLQTEYESNRSISAFLVWFDRSSLELAIQWYTSVSQAYSFRFEMVSTGMFETEEFLVVNTFKEFELD
jgi:hypothetical protein